MKNSKASEILRKFAEEDMNRLDKCIREYTGDVLDTKKRIKHLNRAADFLDGKDDFSEKKLNKTLDTLSDIKDDYKAFKDEFWSNTDDVKKAINTAMDEISEKLNDKDYDYDR